jgi:hypothetical protein
MKRLGLLLAGLLLCVRNRIIAESVWRMAWGPK